LQSGIPTPCLVLHFLVNGRSGRDPEGVARNLWIFAGAIHQVPAETRALRDDASICSFVSRLKRVLVGHWLDSSAIVLAAVSGHRAAGSVRPLPDILMAVGAYLIGSSGQTDLFYKLAVSVRLSRL